MNFTSLKYFIDTAKHGSTKVASELNHVSQPAISQGIKRLESDLSLKLLNHKRNSIHLTAEGKAIVTAAGALFRSITSFNKEVEAIQNGDKGKVSIGVSNSLVPIILTPVLKVFSKLHPQIDVKLKIGRTSEQTKLMEDGEIDIGITINDGSLGGYKTKKLKNGKFVLIGRQNGFERILLTKERPETVLFKRSYDSIGTYVEIDSWSTIVSLAKTGYGKGLAPDFLVPSEKGLIIFSDVKKIKMPTYEVVSFRGSSPLNIAQQKFTKVLEDTFT